MSSGLRIFDIYLEDIEEYKLDCIDKGNHLLRRTAGILIMY